MENTDSNNVNKSFSKGKKRKRLSQAEFDERNDKIKKAKKEFYDQNGETFACYVFKKNLSKIGKAEFDDLRVKILKWQVITNDLIHKHTQLYIYTTTKTTTIQLQKQLQNNDDNRIGKNNNNNNN